MKNFEIEYNDCIDELNDVKLIIRELKVKLREMNLENTLLSIIEDEVIVFIFKNYLIHRFLLTIKILSLMID
jgi:hypothetical protein